jgi:opacity protein-like surface antigen
MKWIVACVGGLVLMSGAAALAQTSDETGYVEAVAQSAFGNITSQSFGAEGGYFFTPQLGVFVEAGYILDTAPAEIGSAAQTIASGLAQLTPSAVAYTVRQPVSFGAGGIRYAFQGTPKLHPYALAGGGAARVKKDVTFTAGGVDVTSNLTAAPYYTTLGSDLSGTVTKPVLVFGGGVNWRTVGSLRIDLGYRFTRIFTDTTGTNVHRAGIGIGMTF